MDPDNPHAYSPGYPPIDPQYLQHIENLFQSYVATMEETFKNLMAWVVETTTGKYIRWYSFFRVLINFHVVHLISHNLQLHLITQCDPKLITRHIPTIIYLSVYSCHHYQSICGTCPETEHVDKNVNTHQLGLSTHPQLSKSDHPFPPWLNVWYKDEVMELY